ncbi:protein IWS1 isoform X2 [Biomphalaria glabrata]|nr:protein IWS1 isoform X2 [Biomphalaria glabrata]
MDSEEDVEQNPSSTPASPVGSYVHSQPGSPARSRSRSRSGSRAQSRSRSRSGSRAQSRSRSRSGSRAKSPSRSRSGSRAASRSRSRSRSGSPANSVGSVQKAFGNESDEEVNTKVQSEEEDRDHPSSPPVSPVGSGGQSPVGSPVRSHSRSRSGSRARSRSPSVTRAQSRSRSRSGSRAKSGSRSRSGSRAKSGSRSRSRSPASSVGSVQKSSEKGNDSGDERPVKKSRKILSDSEEDQEVNPASPPVSPVGSGRRSQSGSPARSRSRRSRLRSRSRSRSRASSAASVQRVSDKENDSEDEVPRKKSRKILSDDEDGKGKGSGDEGEKEKDELIADIFGSSDEDEEFEGFDASEVPKKEKKKKAAVKSDEEDEQGPSGLGEEGSNEAMAEGQGSDDENMDEARKSGEGMFVSDFDLMMQKKKEEMSRQRRKRKDVDLINDNDDLIADLIVKMKEAANLDRELNQKKEVATKKIKMLPYVVNQLKKSDLHGIFLESGILSAMTEWLAPLPDKSLPHLQIRENFLRILQQFPSMHGDMLKSSGIGKAIMYLYKHPREIKENKIIAGKLINEWSRPIFNLTSNYKNLSKEEREQRDYEQLPKKRRTSLEGAQTPKRDIDKALVGEKKALRPGDPGWVYRARVPMPSNKDYVVRPKASSEYQPPQKSSSKKDITRYEKHKRAFMEKKKFSKTIKAVSISIEGRNMAL